MGFCMTVVFCLIGSVKPEVGHASYYTEKSSSCITASGDTYNEKEFTCAKRRGEFGTHCLVISEEGKAVLCRLNDRGPYKRGRITDLSRAAMESLGGIDDGVIKVRVYTFTPQ